MDIKIYDLTLTLIEPMLGTVPKNKDIYTDYIASKAEKSKSENADIADEIATVPVNEERGWTGFHEDEQGIFVYDYLIKGFIKEAGNVLKDEKGVKALKSKLDSYLFVFPRHIYVGTKPDDVFERPLRAMTMQGPRVTLVRSDMVNAGTVLKCELRLLKHKEINEDLLRELLDYGQFQGLGQFRNGSFGRFSYELTERKGGLG